MTVFFLIACASSDSVEDTAAPPTEGSFAVRFQIDSDWQAEMQEEAVGPFWGSVFDAWDVDNTGPYEGTEAIAPIDVEHLDLTAGGPTEVLWTSGPIELERICVLGFLDTDANADPEDPDPDTKDPVTLPNDNKFYTVFGEESEITVWFKFLNP